MKDLKLGHRVKHKVDQRQGMVIGAHQATGVKDILVPVAIEESTRKELWPLDQIELLPNKQQLTALGGSFNPPKGFPFNTK
jgi:hypothetical protein|tara:strand:- start:10325 stop:10567 length:243 start_codon:yes stop_codon:yes gene_type:complete